MERIIRWLLLALVLLLGACILTQVLPFSAGIRLGYWFFVVVALASPVVIVLLFLIVVLGRRTAFYRLRMRRRAVKWKRKEPRAPWPGEGWDAERAYGGGNPQPAPVSLRRAAPAGT